MNVANQDKARRLLTMAGLLMVDLAAQRKALERLVNDRRKKR